MTLSLFTLLVAMCIGSVPGFFVGQWRSEFSRGRFEAKRAWENRNTYRR